MRILDADYNKWVMVEVEPAIWLLMVSAAPALNRERQKLRRRRGKHTILESKADPHTALFRMLQVIKKSWIGPSCPNDALKSFLQTLHSMFVLLHGKITSLLEQVTGIGIKGRVHMHIFARHTRIDKKNNRMLPNICYRQEWNQATTLMAFIHLGLWLSTQHTVCCVSPAVGSVSHAHRPPDPAMPTYVSSFNGD